MKISTIIGFLILLATGESFGKSCTCIQNGGRWETLDGKPCPNIIQTAIPFLRIAPDARSSGMGDIGIATSPDEASIHYNAAKLANIESRSGFQFTYTPWLRALNLDDVFMAQLAGHLRLDKNQVLGAELKYFSLGTIDFKDDQGNPTGTGKPSEMSIGLSYARKLSKYLSASITGRFVYSDLASGQIVSGIEIQAAAAGAADLGIYYDRDVNYFGKKGNLRIGSAITNLGNKVSYSRSVEKEFLPTNIGLGLNYGIDIDEYNSISFGLEFNKLMVPTPPIAQDSAAIANYEKPGTFQGWMQSFSDAPGGFSEELREIIINTGVEYWYDDQFSVRAGYFYEAQSKGARKYLTLGLGLKYNVFGLNFSYLIPTIGQQSALNNTLRFSMLFDFGYNAEEE